MRLLAPLLLAVGALTSSSHHLVKEQHPVPLEFFREADAPHSLVIHLQLMLKQHRFEELEARISDVSNPEHERYGTYLTRMEVNELIEPSSEALDAVYTWLRDDIYAGSDAIKASAARDVLSVSLTVGEAQRLLNTTFGVYRHTDGSRLVRAPEWGLPEHLHEYIVTVQPTTSFIHGMQQPMAWLNGEPHQITQHGQSGKRSTSAVHQACNASAVTPHCLRVLYGTTHYTPQVPGRNQLGLTNFRNQVNNRSDISMFLDGYRPEATSAAEDFLLISVNGGTLQQTPLNETQLRIRLGGEGDLDAEYLLALAWPTPLTSWSVAGAPPFIPDADSQPFSSIEPYLAWLDYVLKQDSLPQVISNSYADAEQTVPPAYARAVCSKFAQLAARGVSFLTGSGDGGVGGVQPGGRCLSHKDNATVQFIPTFPSTCPYVTSVGGTVNFDPEVAAFDVRYNFSSGGGFSNYFRRPDFQADTVATYLDTLGDTFEGLYNKSGRAYPDIAAYSVNITQIWNGTQLIIDGTSASTPIMAAIISLVNDALLAAGKPALGWLNPWLYEHEGKHGFVDVVSGSASGCNTTGFPAGLGWDAVTGFGSPRFDKLLTAAGLDPSTCPGYSSQP